MRQALGTGCARRGNPISALYLGRAASHLRLGGAALRLGVLLPAGLEPRIDLTMTDEYPYAYAQVIISAVPPPEMP